MYRFSGFSASNWYRFELHSSLIFVNYFAKPIFKSVIYILVAIKSSISIDIRIYDDLFITYVQFIIYHGMMGGYKTDSAIGHKVSSRRTNGFLYSSELVRFVYNWYHVMLANLRFGPHCTFEGCWFWGIRKHHNQMFFFPYSGHLGLAMQKRKKSNYQSFYVSRKSHDFPPSKDLKLNGKFKFSVLDTGEFGVLRNRTN